MGKKDGGELGRGALRNAEALRDSIDHFNDRYRLCEKAGEPLAHPLSGMPQEVIQYLRAVAAELNALLQNAP
jgi:deoxycytidylate deaminase